MTLRQEKINSLLQNIISSFIKSEISSSSIITVMRVEISSDLKFAKIFISVFPEEKENEIIKLLEKKAGKLRNHVNDNIKMKFLPYFKFLIDEGEKKRRKIDELLNN